MSDADTAPNAGTPIPITRTAIMPVSAPDFREQREVKAARRPAPAAEHPVTPAAERPTLREQRKGDEPQQHPADRCRHRELDGERLDCVEERVRGDGEMGVIGERIGHAEIAHRFGEDDGQRRPDGGRDQGHDDAQCGERTAAVHAHRRLELLAEPAQRR